MNAAELNISGGSNNRKIDNFTLKMIVFSNLCFNIVSNLTGYCLGMSDQESVLQMQKFLIFLLLKLIQ